MRVVYNAGYGGFGLSTEAKKALGIKHSHDVKRTDPKLLSLYDLNGPQWCSGQHATLAVVVVPDSWKGCWTLLVYDGQETVTFDGERWLKEKLEELAISSTQEMIVNILKEYYTIKNSGDY